MSHPKTDVKGKTAIITGGASGIGAALARALSSRGAKVVLADRQVDLAERLAGELRARGGEAHALALDVRDLDAQRAVVATTLERCGSIDYFFANAGIGVAGEIDHYAQRDWDDVIDVNLRGVVYGVQAVYPVMIRQGFGHIIPTASMAGLVTAVGEGVYGATKHAVVGLGKTLRLEAKRHGVRVSVLCPGAIKTPILTGGKFGRLNLRGLTEEQLLRIWGPARPMAPDVFAERALAAIFANEAFIVLPSWWKALWYLERVSPRASMLLWEQVLHHMRREIEAMGGTAVPGEDR